MTARPMRTPRELRRPARLRGTVGSQVVRILRRARRRPRRPGRAPPRARPGSPSATRPARARRRPRAVHDRRRRRSWPADADVVVEVIGGIEPARSAHPGRDGGRGERRHREQGAARRGRRHPARRGREARRRPLLRGAVAGAIPLLRPLRESLAGDQGPPGPRHRQRHHQLHPGPRWTSGRGLRRGARRPRRSATPRPTRPPTSRASTPRPRPRSSPASPSTPGSRLADVHREGITEVTAADVAAARDDGPRRQAAGRWPSSRVRTVGGSASGSTRR
jgi:homoserine dehydrogenase